MPSEELKTWLKRKRKDGILASVAYALLTIGGGVFFSALTFWLIFMTVKLVLVINFPLFRLATAISLLIALLICSAIFLEARYADRDDMSIFPLWLLREYVGIGPRLILEGYPDVLRVRQWLLFDLETGATVLLFLAGRDRPTRQGDLLSIFPDLDWERLRKELRLVPGVIFFQPDELRVTLTLPLRMELRQFRKRVRIYTPEREPEPEVEPIPVPEPHQLTPAEILGVGAGATMAEIRSAYRIRIKECHPDRFATMDERSRELAEEWTKSLNAAYETLMNDARRR